MSYFKNIEKYLFFSHNYLFVRVSARSARMVTVQNENPKLCTKLFVRTLKQ